MNMDVIITEHLNNGIKIIKINRPEAHNAFDDHLIKLLLNELIVAEQDDAVRVVMLTAEGNNFSAGADLAWMKRMVNYSHQENVNDALMLATLLKKISYFPKPTIALAQGKTFGGGVGLLACCDIIIANDNASFCFSEAKLGLVPATIAPYVVQAIGVRQAQYYFLTAESFDALTAQRIGLVHQICSSSNLQENGLILAHKLLNNSPNALATIKRLITKIQNWDEALLQQTAEMIAEVRASTEAQEGMKAFFEKRAPSWVK